jgi:hypothetical protein
MKTLPGFTGYEGPRAGSHFKWRESPMLGTEQSRALSALATQVHHCTRRLVTLRQRKPSTNPPNNRGVKPWTAERILAEIEGQERRLEQALASISRLIAEAERSTSPASDAPLSSGPVPSLLSAASCER